VRDVLTIFYHGAFQGAEDRLAQAGLSLHTLATWDDILKADLGGRLDAESRKQIEVFLADPVAWSTRHGGRSVLSSRRR
jgi:orotate phosphoribosyltransferase